MNKTRTDTYALVVTAADTTATAKTATTTLSITVVEASGNGATTAVFTAPLIVGAFLMSSM